MCEQASEQYFFILVMHYCIFWFERLKLSVLTTLTVPLMAVVQVFYGLLKEPEIEVPLDDEDEEAENEEGKPKKKKPKKDSMGSKSKKQDPNAPQQTRYITTDTYFFS